jgi:flagellar basal-body rod protein FlgC
MNIVPPIQGTGPLSRAMASAASGMRAEALRARLVAENLANANSTATGPKGQPYQRKLMTFAQAVDHATGAVVVKPGRSVPDKTPFRTIYDPSHPAADATGYVKLPNVSEMVEEGDGREAERSYEANLAMMSQARSMYSKTLDILKA